MSKAFPRLCRYAAAGCTEYCVYQAQMPTAAAAKVTPDTRPQASADLSHLGKLLEDNIQWHWARPQIAEADPDYNRGVPALTDDQTAR